MNKLRGKQPSPRPWRTTEEVLTSSPPQRRIYDRDDNVVGLVLAADAPAIVAYVNGSPGRLVRELQRILDDKASSDATMLKLIQMTLDGFRKST